MLVEINESDWQNSDEVYALIVSPFCMTCHVAEQMVEEAIHYVVPFASVYKLNLQLTKAMANDLEIQSVPTLLHKRNDEVSRLVPISNSVNVMTWIKQIEEGR